MSGQTGVTTNTPATGQPTIAGTVEVRETLTAATSAISDDNGLTNAVFSHQWVRSANGSDNDITNATGSTYVITNADIDKAIKVRVSFTDDDGYSETLHQQRNDVSTGACARHRPAGRASDCTSSWRR